MQSITTLCVGVIAAAYGLPASWRTAWLLGSRRLVIHANTDARSYIHAVTHSSIGVALADV